MVGGLLPPPPVTVNVSVRHWVAVLTGLPAADVTPPLTSNKLVVVTVFGPAMTKLLKSIRN